MDLPADIQRLLGDAAPQAAATLGCGLASPIGETVLVVAAGRLHAFTRESFISEFAEVALDHSRPPGHERGDFNDTLSLEGADGDVWELNVSSFERDNVLEVLAALAAPAPAAKDPTLEQDIEEHLTRAEDLLSKFEALAEGPPPAPAERPPPPHAPRPPAPEPAVGEAADEADPPKVAARHAGATVYHGNDMPLGGCLAQLAFFAAGIFLLWHAHEMAIATAMQYVDITGDLFEPVFVISKIAAIVCGAYLGGRAAGVVSAFARSKRWPGYIEFKGRRLVCVGQSSRSMVEFDLDRPIAMTCLVQRPSTTTSSDSNTPVKRTFNFLVTLKQGDREWSIRTHRLHEEHWLGVQGLETSLVDELPKPTASGRMDIDVLRLVLKRIRESVRPRR